VADLHPGIAVLTPLLGTWSGQGAGEYPTIEPFGYVEEVTFGHVGKPFLVYGQRTKASDDGRPLHAETGYLRLSSPDRVELVLAHPTGITEIQEGTLSITGTTLEMELTATAIGLFAAIPAVVAYNRYAHDIDRLAIRFAIGNARTTPADVRETWDLVLCTARRLATDSLI